MPVPREPVNDARAIRIEPDRSGLRKRRVAAARLAGGLLTLITLAALLTGPSRAAARQPVRPQTVTAGRTSATVPAIETGPPALILAPGNGAGAVAVNAYVTVVGRQSTLDSVALADAAGRPVRGEFDAGRRGWHSTAALAYDTRYTLTASATVTAGTAGGAGAGTTAAGNAGTKLRQTSTFRTVKPVNLTMPYLRANTTTLLTDRATFGVGQPIVVGFDEAITDRAAAQKALEVRTDPPVDGAWHWFSDHEVHWRPQAYWRPGTKVTVTAHLYGVNLGKGLYGQSDATASFTIGRSQIAIADDRTFQIQVFIDGKLARTIPTAMGLHSSITTPKGQWIDLRTHSGVHVVLGKSQVTRMTSASYGLTGPNSYDELVYWTTQISYSGEYVHAAPWSVAQQGHSDASHGCLNVNTDNAVWFYNTFIPGDVVDIRNTGLQLDAMDGLGDWTLSWADWIKGSAVPYRPAPARGRWS